MVDVTKLFDLIIDQRLEAALSSGVIFAHIGRIRDAVLDRFVKEFNSDVAFHTFRGPFVISPTIVSVCVLAFSFCYVADATRSIPCGIT